MDYTIFDIEADELLDKVTLIHCFSWWRSDGTSGTITDISLIPAFVQQQKVLIGHNIKRYDNPVIRKILGFTIHTRCIDTLPISWYLNPEMKKHGLEEWGDILGVAKPEILDWKNLTLAQYVFRCETDVVINKLLFHKFINHLLLIYGNQPIDNIMDYLTYKMDCAAEQEEVGVKINVPYCHQMLEEVTAKVSEKAAILSSHMPKDIKYNKPKTKPAKMYLKADKSGVEALSVAGAKWFEMLFDKGLPADYEGEVITIKSEAPGNPGSPAQLKAWLYELGWHPTLYNYVKDKNTKKVRAVAQISDKDGNLCLNIQSLFEQHPYLEELKSFTMLKHRQGVFKGFIESANEQGFMKAEIAGLTNTLRFKHTKPIANLPGVNKPYGKEIRGAIIIPDENHLFCGSDMSSLEDTTKQHYMYYYDPEYVMQMRVPGFDPHIDIGVLANMLTELQAERFKYLDSLKELTPTEKIELSGLKKIRGKAKVVNFSGIYGAGPAKIALTTGMTLEEATLLHKIYWERNKAVKLICKDVTIKVIFKSGLINTYIGRELLAMNREQNESFMSQVKEMWLYNPVSQFWYSLRYFKDIFSTLNQGTGVFCFDTWISKVRPKGIKIALQYHDEIGFPFLKEELESVKIKLTQGIQETNELLKLNVPLGISIDIGLNYAECH